jgi:hypothetical protein
MSAQAAGRIAAQAGKAAAQKADGHVLNKGAKRDPELYVCPILENGLRYSSFYQWLTGLCRFFLP